GHRCVEYCPLVFVTSTGAPPPAATRLIGAKRRVKTIVCPSGLQLPPRPSGAAHNMTAFPPETGIFFSALSRKKAIQRPSGDQNGNIALAVPWSCRGISESSERTQRGRGNPDSFAPKTMDLSTGQFAGGAAENKKSKALF